MASCTLVKLFLLGTGDIKQHGKTTFWGEVPIEVGVTAGVCAFWFVWWSVTCELNFLICLSLSQRSHKVLYL